MKALAVIAALLLSCTVHAAAPQAPTGFTVVTPQAGVNPFGIAFGKNSNVFLYANPGGLIIAGRCETHSTSAAMQAVRAGGGEVLQYIIPSEVPDNGGACALDKTYYSGYGKPVPLWPYPLDNPGTRRKWVGTKMTDMRPGSPWILYTVSFIEKMMIERKVDGVFLDTVGAQTWAALADWNSWSLEEKNAYTAGNVDLVRRVDEKRKIHNPGFIVSNNSVWQRNDNDPAGLVGERYVNGICLEHPKFGENGDFQEFHLKYLAKPFGNPEKRRVLVIANSQQEARAWALVPGVTHVSGQTTAEYSYPLAPAVPFSAIGADQ